MQRDVQPRRTRLLRELDDGLQQRPGEEGHAARRPQARVPPHEEGEGAPLPAVVRRGKEVCDVVLAEGGRSRSKLARAQGRKDASRQAERGSVTKPKVRKHARKY